MGSPLIFTDVGGVRAFSRECRRDGKTIGFVPTMGYLHDGHVSLIHAAREKCDVVIVSIYVNPTQFSVNEDFGVYPRSQEADLAKLTAAGVAAAFIPPSLYHQPLTRGPADASMVVGSSTSSDMDSHCTWVNVEHLSQGLCAGSRPHFFRGVCTVVTKLFNIVEPDAAFFGRKDFQQYRILERMVRDLDFPIEVVGVPIVREPDGLAMSSRNAMLTTENRAKATCIYQALCRARDDAVLGRVRLASTLQDQVARDVESSGGRVDYVRVVHSMTLQPIDEAGVQPTLIAVAAFFGSVRLIDNVDI